MIEGIVIYGWEIWTLDYNLKKKLLQTSIFEEPQQGFPDDQKKKRKKKK